MRSIFVFPSLLIIGIVAYCYYRPAAPVVPPPTAVSYLGESNSRPLSTAQRSDKLESSATIDRHAAGPISRELMRAYNSAQSYREFIHSAIRVPEQGGYMYAFHVLVECERFSDWSAKAGTTESQQRAISALNSRCDISPADRANFLREINFDRQANFLRDPLLATMADRLVNAKDQAERSAISKQVLEWTDPLTLSGIQTRESVRNSAGENVDRFYLNGKWYEGRQADQMVLAWQLANCELGINCGLDATDTLKLCATRNWCGTSVTEAVKEGLMRTDGTQLENVMYLRNQILDGVKSKDVGVFIGPNGNPPAM